MSFYATNFNLNQRISYLEYLLTSVFQIPTLSVVLQTGNSAGEEDIDLNGQNLVGVNQISSRAGDVTLDVEDRLYQELNPSPTWSNVNGFYELAKDVYPSINPVSNGVKAVTGWNLRNTPVDNNWNSVCWSPELRLFVSCSSSGFSDRRMISTDGLNWNVVSSNNNSWASVCWSPELRMFVMVGGAGGQPRINFSSNGISWTEANAPFIQWTSICWSPELRLFCAVAASGVSGNRAMTSPNGIDWTLQNSAFQPTISNAWRSVCWADTLGLFVAVSSSGGTLRAMTSPNGVNWTIRSTGSSNSWTSVCWSRELGLLVAVANTGTGNRVITSPNGINWTLRTTPADNTWSSVCWSPELQMFVAVASTGTSRVMYSSNGINWTLSVVPTNDWQSVCWAPELGFFAAVSSTGVGQRVMTSMMRARPPSSFNTFDSSFNSIDGDGNWTLKARELRTTDSDLLIETTSGDLDLRCNTTGEGGSILLTGGTGLRSGTSGGNSGKHLSLTINNRPYKVQLLNP